MQSLVMGQNIVNFIAQINYCSKYSSVSVFSKVTIAIVNVIALHFAISSECSAVNFECREVIFNLSLFSQSNLNSDSSLYLIFFDIL